MTVKTVTVEGFLAQLVKLSPEIERATIKGLRSAAAVFDGMVLEEIDNAKPRPAVDRGELRNSRELIPTPMGAIVLVAAPHAAIIEYGTRPFWAPLEPLKRWALRKGIADDEEEAEEIAHAVQYSIASRGIAPRHYFSKAWANFIARGILGREVSAEINKMPRSR